MRRAVPSIISIALLAACGPDKRSGTPTGDDDDGPTPDAPVDPTGDGSPTTTTFVYAHSPDTLYKVDPDTLAITKVGDFGWSNGFDEMTDIAIDKTGKMIGISMTGVYLVDPANASAMQLTDSLSGGFNGLSYVPADQLGQTGDDVLIATRNSDGKVFRVDPMTGATTQVGSMGSSYSSSGDLVAVQDFGTVLTADNGLSNDRLVRLAPSTFAATPIGSSINFSDIWGVAFWKGKIFGFTSSGQFITIDATTGAGTLVSTNSNIAWWGAAVTTTAPVIF